MLAADIPPDVWIAIKDLIKHPQGHIALSQLCQTSRSIYEGEEKWKLLCRSIGVGRPIVEKDLSWKRVFMEVVGHRTGCKVPACYQFAVPPTNVVGDLLPSPQAVLEHLEYFRLHAPVKTHVCPFSPGMIDGGADGDEGDEGNMDAGEGDDLNPNDPTNPGHVPVDPAAALLAVDPNAIMASLFTMLGVAPPPAGTLNATLAANSVPLAGGAAYLFPAVLGGTQPAALADPAVPDLPAPPAITPRLLPLSLKNKELVPHKPALHPFIIETGAVQFERFLAGKTNLNPFPMTASGGKTTPVGVDWDAVDEGSGEDWNDRLLVDIQGHPLLERAFATNPPVTCLNFNIERLAFRVVNKNGVTIKDVIHNMNRYLHKALSAQDRKTICPCQGQADHTCPLDNYKTRLDYLCRHFYHPGSEVRAETESESNKGKVAPLWLRGLLDIDKDGQAICALYP